jgi:hypothetical protein
MCENRSSKNMQIIYGHFYFRMWNKKWSSEICI